ncbi:MAG: hypothetical protein QOD75_2461 [Blastocatellia bacterium]|jgi:hypothetical protein|nr:hypothetical protein [Blastocatellia bacterium]
MRLAEFRKHANNDSKEATEFWHAAILLRQNNACKKRY